MTTFSVPRRESAAPYVMAIDVGSGGTRVGVYDASGREVGGRRTRLTHTLSSGSDGSSTIDADAIVEEVRRGIEHLAPRIPGPIAAVGIDTFASSLVPVDAAGNALGPCITYADTRSGAHAVHLARELDGDRLHDLTGARLHSSYLAPRLAWLREEWRRAPVRSCSRSPSSSDRKSTRLNSSHVAISYAVFCLK